MIEYVGMSKPKKYVLFMKTESYRIKTYTVTTD